MENCVIYARYSSDRQDEQSIDAQVRACTEHAERKGYAVTTLYVDKALSATTDDRPEFKRMIKDSAGGGFNVVLVHKFDRFSRDTFVHDLAKNQLKVNGARLESVLEPLDDSPESVISESLFKGMAEYYSRNLSREVRKGIREKLAHIRATGIAVHMGGLIPYGYDLTQNKEYIINESEAEVVRHVYKLYAYGKGYHAIANDLTAKRIRNKQGRAISIDFVRCLLRYEQFTGVFIFRTNPTNEIYRKNKKFLKPKMIENRIDGAMPQIISKETYQMAEDKMKVNQRTGKEKKAREPYLLTGLIHCASCGAVMIGNRSPDNAYYVCPNRSKSKTCAMPSVKRDNIENCILTHIEKHFNAEIIEGFIELLDAKKAEYAIKSKSKLFDIDKELKKVCGQIELLLDELMNGNGSEAVRTRLAELEGRKKQLQEQSESTQTVEQGATLTREQIAVYANNLKDIRQKTREEQQRIVKSAITNVRLSASIQEGNKKPTFTAEISSIFGELWVENWSC